MELPDVNAVDAAIELLEDRWDDAKASGDDAGVKEISASLARLAALRVLVMTLLPIDREAFAFATE